MIFKSVKIHIILVCALVVSFFSCSKEESTYTIKVDNNTHSSRVSESIEIWFNQLDSILPSERNLEVFNALGRVVNSQKIDIDNDSIIDYLLFQTDMKPQESKLFTLKPGNEIDSKENDEVRTYCRFVSERIDDFAWENDRVAFRTYGPECQRLFEKGNPSGLISSGIDCWLKRVDYSIIDKWYTNHQNGLSYHEDRGEGLDNYHVGTTRGCGGTALWCNDQSYISQNFSKWRIIANGPIRSIFELEYEAFDVCGNIVSETKTISIDLGQNFYKCDILYSSEKQLSTGSAGITLHNGNGEINSNINEGWISYWEPLDDSFLGTAVLLDPVLITDSKLDPTINEDESLNNIYIHSKLIYNGFSYWSGFGWEKRGQFSNQKEWTNFLSEVAFQKQHPLKVEILKK